MVVLNHIEHQSDKMEYFLNTGLSWTNIKKVLSEDIKIFLFKKELRYMQI